MNSDGVVNKKFNANGSKAGVFGTARAVGRRFSSKEKGRAKDGKASDGMTA
ncbi:MAG TPA: hypothetical protein VKD70_13285 [Candidatus Acidoferrum sp.]|nr:hypothetical protein [Candidatus Acidoferrum sp.]